MQQEHFQPEQGDTGFRQRRQRWRGLLLEHRGRRRGPVGLRPCPLPARERAPRHRHGGDRRGGVRHRLHHDGCRRRLRLHLRFANGQIPERAEEETAANGRRRGGWGGQGGETDLLCGLNQEKRGYGEGGFSVSTSESNENKKGSKRRGMEKLVSNSVIVSLPLTLKLTPLSHFLSSLYPSSIYFYPAPTSSHLTHSPPTHTYTHAPYLLPDFFRSNSGPILCAVFVTNHPSKSPTSHLLTAEFCHYFGCWETYH